MKRTTKHFLSTLLIAASLGLSACATGPTIRTDYDPTASFAQYQTWGFYQPIAMEASGYSTWMSDRIKADIRKEMDARGYRYVDAAPDLQVNFQSVVEDKTSVWSMPRSDVRWYYSYRHKSYVAVPVWYDETQVSQYRQGTLTVDLVDAKQNRMVWTGAAISGAGGKYTPEQRLAKVDLAITRIFAKYPHRAGTP